MSILDDFEVYDFDGPLEGGNRVSHPVYFLGAGPPVVIMQELPGIGPATGDLARALVAEGYRVYLPHVFGPLGKFQLGRNLFRLFCMRREFHMFAAGKASPIVTWMAALCRDVRDRNDGAQVAAIGMCLTGGFALTLMADDAVLAAVAAQPSLPLFQQSALHMSKSEIAAARAGMAAKGPALAMRYEGDKLCTSAKTDAIAAAFGDLVEIHQLPGKQHATLTDHHSPEGWAHVLRYLAARLKGAG
jgi:dienelactone hydrolase